MDFLSTVPGPVFLLIYLLWFFLVWATVLVLRQTGYDTKLTTIGGLVLFEGLGLVRFVLGSSHGMHNWTGLFIMMGVGALFFLVRLDHLGGGNSSGSCSGGSVSSCGGSSCGGGGCGGCGGS